MLVTKIVKIIIGYTIFGMCIGYTIGYIKANSNISNINIFIYFIILSFVAYSADYIITKTLNNENNKENKNL